MYLPAHVMTIYKRIWYYAHGEKAFEYFGRGILRGYGGSGGANVGNGNGVGASSSSSLSTVGIGAVGGSGSGSGVITSIRGEL